RLEASPAGGRAAIGDPVARQRRLTVRVVTAKVLRADPPRVHRQREPGPGAIGEAHIEAVAGHESERAPRWHSLQAGRKRSGQLDPVLERGARIRVVQVAVERGAPAPPEPDLDPLAARLPHALDAHAGGSGRGHREDVIADIGAIERYVYVEPGEWARLHPDLIVRPGHCVEGRIGRDTYLESWAHRARPRAGQLEKRRHAVSLRLARGADGDREST